MNQTIFDRYTKEFGTRFLRFQKHKLAHKKSDGFIKINTLQNHGLLAGEWMGAGVLGESPSDQRLDDGLAVVFESDILENNLDILGFPLLNVKLASDKEKAEFNNTCSEFY